MNPSIRTAAALILCGFAGGAAAQGLCPAVEADSQDWPPLPAELTDFIVITADHAEVERTGRAEVSGNIQVTHQDVRLQADRAVFDPESERFELSGNVRIDRDGVRLSGKTGVYDSRDADARLTGAEFLIVDRAARGSANIIRSGRGDPVKLKDMEYTTCPPGDEDWLLRAQRVELDKDTGRGSARSASLRFQGVPFFYMPYFTFPLDDRRKSGLLIPELGNSDRSGTDLRVPVYWNIAPNYDYTFTPRLLSKRGVQYANEFRYLLGKPASAGTMVFEYLPSDDERNGTERRFMSLKHQTRFKSGWWANIDASDTSDSEYFEDLGSVSSSISTTHLERLFQLERFTRHLSLIARLQNFQTLDDDIESIDKPYRRLPQVLLSGDWPDQWLGLGLGFDSEFVHFDRSVGATGQRIDIAPRLELPLEGRGRYFRAAGTYRYTGYFLDDLPTDAEEEPDRSVPIFSAETGLRLQREGGDDGRVLHILEPRIQYVYIPYRNHGDIPVFDTTAPDFNLVQLFRENRFVGPDRLGDTNRLAYGLTTRLLDSASGRQYLSATIGQQHLFDDERVTLPGQPADSSGASDTIAELEFGLFNAWNVDLDLRWDHREEEFQKAAVRFQYRPDEDRVANLSYRRIENQVEQIDLSAAWPVMKRWRLVGRYNYSFEEDSEIERFLGFEYETCCWTLRGVWRRLITDREGSEDTSILLQLELKGLTNVGSGVETLLERGIFGYTD